MTPDRAPRRVRIRVFPPLALAVLAALAWARPLNHDESQYVAAARLVADGLLPYRDFAYLQTPLQPFAFAPLVALAGDWAWPALRLANAALGAAALVAAMAAARAAGASRRAALVAAGLMASCDVFLFSVGTARNDALPAALFAAALIPVARAGGPGRGGAALSGALLAAAAAAKVSYAIPAAAYGMYALLDRRHRPLWVAIGAAPVVFGVLLSAWTAFDGFWFGVVEFPARGPADYYAATGRAWRLGVAAKLVDTLKWLALGPALLAIPVLFWRRDGVLERFSTTIRSCRAKSRHQLQSASRLRSKRTDVGGGSLPNTALDVLLAAAVVAALLPSPTWRQYLLPILPVLFVRLALAWSERPPGPRLRAAFAVFAVAGVAPTLVSLARREPAMPVALHATRAVAAALDAEGVEGGVATLAPELLGRRAPDPRFAAGPFAFRSPALVTAERERALRLITRARLDALGAPPAVLTGAEAWTSGDPRLDAGLDRWAAAHGYRARALPGPLTLWIRPRAPASPR